MMQSTLADSVEKDDDGARAPAPAVKVRTDETGTRSPRAPSTRKAMVEVPRGNAISGGSARVQEKEDATSTPRVQEKRSVKEMALWFSEGNKPLKLPQPGKVGTDKDANTDENQINSRSYDQSHRDINYRSASKLANTTLAKPENITANGVKASRNLLGTNPLDLQPRNLEERKFGALAKRELEELEAEREVCRPHGGNLREMDNVIERALRIINHEGDMDINQATEYHEYILDMQRKFEDMSSRLRNTRIDLASVKHIFSNCVRLRCRCHWCRTYSGVHKAYSRLRSILAIKLPTFLLSKKEVRAKEKPGVELRRRRSFNFRSCCLHVASGRTGSESVNVDC